MQTGKGNKPESVRVLKAGDFPKRIDYWQGRVEEIEQLHQWLADDNIRLTGIEGIGGTGKSMLAAKIYEEIEGFSKLFWANVSSGGIIFSDLARRVLTDFGCRVPEEELQLVNALVRCLRSGKYLLVIDGLENLLKTDGQWKSQFYEEFFRTWIEYGGGSKILVTTRERPDLQGFEWLHLKGLKTEEGASWLKELGIRGEVEAFTELVDGHPLLLKLVADLIKDEYPQDPSLEHLADLGLGNLQQLLTDPRVVGQHRRENVGMVLVLDSSFKPLADWQRIWLQNVSVYRGSFDAEAAMAMLPQPSDSCPLPVERGEVEQELRKLVKRSLLEEKLNHKRQFTFQPMVLEYVRNKAGDQAEAHHRAIDYYRSIVKEKPWQTIDDLKEYLEIFYHLCQLQEYVEADKILSDCDEFLNLRGYYSTIVELNQQLVQVWQPSNKEKEESYSVLNRLGNAYLYLGQYQKAINYNQQILEIARDIGDRSLEGISLNNVGLSYWFLGQYQTAINYNQQALEIARDIDDCSLEGMNLDNLGKVYNALGQYQTAINYNQQALEIARDISNRSLEGISLNDLGFSYCFLGQYQTAIDYYQQALEIARNIGNRKEEGATLGNLGNAYNSVGQYQTAINYHQQALEIARNISDRNLEGISLNNLGNAYNALGQYQTAIDYYEQALEIARDIGNRKEEGTTLGNLGNAYLCLGQYQTAIDYYQQALEIARDISDRNSEGTNLNNLGLSYWFLGQYQTAIDYNQQALEIARDIGNRSLEGRTLGNLGNAYNSVGQYQTAIDYNQQALEIARDIDDRSGEGTNLNNLGNAYNSVGQYQTAIDYYQQALKIARDIGNRKEEGTTLGNLGSAYNALGQYQTAIDHNQQALEMARDIGDRSGEETTLGNLGNAYNALEQYQTAIDYHQRALEIARDIGDRSEQANFLGLLGIAYNSLGQYQTAIDYNQQALEIFREIDNRSMEAILLKVLGKSYYSLKQYQQAIDAYRNARELYEAMGLDTDVQDCDEVIELLSQKSRSFLSRFWELIIST